MKRLFSLRETRSAISLKNGFGAFVMKNHTTT
jgi:hypothetical protein